MIRLQRPLRPSLPGVATVVAVACSLVAVACVPPPDPVPPTTTTTTAPPADQVVTAQWNSAATLPQVAATVPAGVCRARVEVVGGNGGAGSAVNGGVLVDNENSGGRGAVVAGELDVVPGEVLTLVAAIDGFPGRALSFPSSADAEGWGFGGLVLLATRPGDLAGGVGGGAAALLRAGAPLVVAGGGGGGATGASGRPGGDAGAGTGTGVLAGADGSSFAGRGATGGAEVAGRGGATITGRPGGDAQGRNGGSAGGGVLGGGSGGGGFFGGGGGAGSAGGMQDQGSGGGGSSLVPTGTAAALRTTPGDPFPASTLTLLGGTCP